MLEWWAVIRWETCSQILEDPLPQKKKSLYLQGAHSKAPPAPQAPQALENEGFKKFTGKYRKKYRVCKMASSQLPKRHNFIRPPTPRSRRYTVAPDTIDEILSTALNWVLPVLFFCVIIVLVTMLTTYTLVMRRPLPRAFTFVIVITLSLLITITFFTLVAFHIYRSQRVRSMLSEVRLSFPPGGPLYKPERMISSWSGIFGKPSASTANKISSFRPSPKIALMIPRAFVNAPTSCQALPKEVGLLILQSNWRK